ncbi:tetratricopeptide repeat protein [Anabaena cylindrica FACHB-243]|uniref:Tetratricopeptide TPR_2 repeat-containing protein n=1 Tax=Anabaena cylindrica (strain ATCC 27899 / PCC 7122) TaxID=272123 RepID=K9ZKH3_ANACC|nr:MULTISPECIES: tetratricopeptide repeat protein [Anabaena]AFZ59067.1 Tetratricopeptide TPR_2 repeat-containing protein [Anabaena cylindrica PCC 7122]MBD2420594.1 tetratricopeptide repeat protein [Anabaena cylindrica FACHB-243]MBY5282345.1 tetratricopeptide repeat protein [Anabaena sp. CCAP 1446/1C]MBY5309244.1 tetratricopeptide repeat protein [Anabaena sp. CCAP 1446/1C]MCM2408552.1 tetratricopeptide repeat protein [Anabaena sp. CCAP 1446/1C]
MDWITLLRSLQSDFLQRLKSGCLLHCQTEGQHSEITIISGERLKALREFCWLMAEKYKRTSPVRDVFINNLKGKLGEELVKERLSNFITEVDYEKRFGGDGKSDFTLTAHPTIGVEVKSRHGTIDKVRWTVSCEEVEKNTVIVCILIQEEVNEAQSEYHLFLAGFLPTKMIKLKTGKISFGINQLLYGGGLLCYLEQSQNSTNNSHQQQSSINQFKTSKNELIKSHVYSELDKYPALNSTLIYEKLGDKYFQKGDYAAAINNYNQALQDKHQDANIYYKLGLVYHQLGDYKKAIIDYSQAINININYSQAYNKRGLAHYQLGNYQTAIEDYNQAIRINPDVAVNYRNRAEARSHIGDHQGAIEDYNQAIKINPLDAITQKNREITRYLLDDQQKLVPEIKIAPDDAVAYKNRGNTRLECGNYEGAIEDYNQAIQINPNYADAYYNRGNAHSDLGNYEAAIDDFSKVIKVKSNYTDAYYNRGNVRLIIGDKQGAIEDFQQAADLYWQHGKLEEHKETQARILDLEIEKSLDILNF